MAKGGGRRQVAAVWCTGLAVLLGAACGIDASGEGSPSDLGDDAGGEEDTACGTCATGDDASLALPPPEKDASLDAKRESSAPRGDASAPPDAPADCNATCVMQTCGGACAQGSVCQLYLGCLVLCGFSDAALCTDGCNAQYPTGPLLAACALACGASCASGSGGSDGGAAGDGAAD